MIDIYTLDTYQLLMGRAKLPKEIIKQHRREYQAKFRREHPEYVKLVNEKRNARLRDDLEYRDKIYARRNLPEVRLKTELKRRENPIHFWVRNVRDHHKRRGYSIEATFDEMVKLCETTKDCRICGVALNWDYIQNGGIHARSQSSPSLDRIDNERIMSKQNLQLLCLKCNVTKGDRTMKQFIQYCSDVADKFLIKEVKQ